MNKIIHPKCPKCGNGEFYSADQEAVAKAAFFRMKSGQEPVVVDGKSIRMTCAACGHVASHSEVYSN